MYAFREQQEAINAAQLLIEKLPHSTVWALTVTDDDCLRSPSVLNVYYRDDEEAKKLAKLLQLGNPIDVDKNEEFASWKIGVLLVSLIHHTGDSHVR